MREKVPLAPLTTIGIGGPARFLLEVRSADSLVEGLRWAGDAGMPLFILGGGSNVLIADEGFDGLVILHRLRGRSILSSSDDHVEIQVAAGESWDDFVAWAVLNRWAGVECLSGIPGSVGATPIQNVGAYGQEVSETITRVELLDRGTRSIHWLSNEECGFGYRDSVFKREALDREVVLSVVFRLRPGGAATIRYPELATLLEERKTSKGDLRQVRETVIDIRKRKGMVIDPGDPDSRSDGSFFMNPIVGLDAFRDVVAKASAQGIPEERIPNYPAGGGMLKLSAAWLIESAGFSKGYGGGKAGLSGKHTLAIVNRGGASAREVVALVAEIRDAVRGRFGVELRAEPRFIGFPG